MRTHCHRHLLFAAFGLVACATTRALAPPPTPVAPWGRWASTEADDAFYRVAVGPDGAVYTTGRDRLGAFVARFDADGTRAWRHTLRGVTPGAAPSVAVTAAGDVYVGGGFEGRFRVDTTAFSTYGRKDIFLVRLDAAGQVAWARQYGGPHFETLHAVAADAGGVYLGGTYQDDCALGGVTLRNGSNLDAFVARLDGRGDHVWSARMQDRGELGSRVSALALSPDGDVFIAGTTGRDLPSDGGATGEDPPAHAFVARLAPGGAFRWLRAVASSGPSSAEGLALAPDGRVVVAGRFAGTLPAPDGAAVTARASDVFVASWSGRGTPRWTRTFGSEGIDAAYAVATDEAGDVLVAGRVAGEVRRGDEVWPADGVDGFVARFDRNGAPWGRRMFASPAADAVSDLRAVPGGFALAGTGGALALAAPRAARDESADGFVFRAPSGAIGEARGRGAAAVAVVADEPGHGLPARPLPELPEEDGSVINLQLSSSEGNSFADLPFVVEAEDWRFEGRSTAGGRVSFRVPSVYRQVTLDVPDAHAHYEVNVGTLDPIDERSGVIERLVHLGLFSTSDPSAAPEESVVARAIQNFQGQASLPSTGRLDEETLAAILREHGS